MRPKLIQREMLLQPRYLALPWDCRLRVSPPLIAPPQVCLLPVTHSEISLPSSPATLRLLEVCLPHSLDVVDGPGQVHLKSVGLTKQNLDDVLPSFPIHVLVVP